MGKEVGYQLGSTMGMVEKIDTDEEGVGWGKFLRVRIRLDLTKSLARGRIINLFGKQVLIAFQYERLPRYCFDCGRICHGRGGCTNKSDFRKTESEKQYGPWLRVPSPRRRKDHSRARYYKGLGEEQEMYGAPNFFAGEGISKSTESRVSGKGEEDPTGRPEKNPKTATPTATRKAPIGEGASVMDVENINGKGGFSGENLDVVNDPNHAKDVDVTAMQNGNNNKAINEEQRGGEDFGPAKGKNKCESTSRDGNNCKNMQRRSAEEMRSVMGEKLVTGGIIHRENSNELAAGEGFNQVQVAQKWKRRARSGQRWPEFEAEPVSNGKRKNEVGQGAASFKK